MFKGPQHLDLRHKPHVKDLREALPQVSLEKGIGPLQEDLPPPLRHGDFYRDGGGLAGFLVVLWVDGNRLQVQGIDMLDGTPILDLKPYVPAAGAAAVAGDEPGQNLGAVL